MRDFNGMLTFQCFQNGMFYSVMVIALALHIN